MQRQYNIKWRDIDVKQLKQVIKNFNAKLSRILKNNPDAANYLPQKLSYKTIKASITNRQDYNKVIHSIKRFSRKGAEQKTVSKHGVPMTKWTVREYGIQKRTINRIRNIERKRVLSMETTDRGKPTGFKRGEMGSIRANSLLPKTTNLMNVRNKSELDHALRSMYNEWWTAERLARAEIYKESYIKAIINNLGTLPESDYLVSLLDGLDAKQITDNYYMEEQADIKIPYDRREALEIINQLISIWEPVAIEAGIL